MSKIDCRAILRLKGKGLSRRKIALSLGCSRDTVKRVLNRAEKKGIAWEDVKELSVSEAERLLFPERKRRGDFVEPNYEYVHEELAKPKVTLALLYEEYCEQCKSEGRMFYCYSQFCNKYRDYAKREKATMRIAHKPGDVLEVDWAGDVLAVHDEDSGSVRKAYLFVACLPYSQLVYAEAFLDMKSENWITANVHALEYIDGVPEGIVPDNLKTGVVRHTKNEIVIASAYQDLAEYYGTVILPARVRAPKDKASVERSVGLCETWVSAKLRNQKFLSLEELNRSIRILVDELNERPFQKKKGSRRSVFETEESTHLRPLPAIPYEVPVWKTIKVQPDYLVEAAGTKYSVPYEYIGETVRVRIRRATIEVFYSDLLIASHTRQDARKEPVYNPEHMPPKHRMTLTYTEDSCREWAADAGGSIAAVASGIFDETGPVQQKVKLCRSLMQLADKFSLARLESACTTALNTGSRPSIDLIETLLRKGREEAVPTTTASKPPVTAKKTAGLTRGTAYYTRGVK